MAETFEGQPLFREEQRFRQPWLLALVFGSAALTLALLAQALFPKGLTSPAVSGGAWIGVIASLAAALGALLLIITARLTVEVHPEGVRYRFLPFHRKWKTLYWREFRSQQAITYHPIIEYGGWGLRRGRQGWAYNVSGDRGVRFTLNNGRTLLLGSHRAEQLSEAVRAASGIGEA